MDNNSLNQSCAPAIDIHSSIELGNDNYENFPSEMNNDIIKDILKKLENVIKTLISQNCSVNIINELSNVKDSVESIKTENLNLNNIIVTKTMIYDGNEKYEGQFKNNLRDGKGTYYYSNGNKYIGEWKDDKIN